MNRDIKPLKSQLIKALNLLTSYKLYIWTYVFYIGLFGSLIIDYLFQTFYLKRLREVKPQKQLINADSTNFCPDCKDQSIELTKTVEKLQFHYSQLMKHHVKQTCKNEEGELICPVCTMSFDFGNSNRNP